ncbi:SDR family NAD(P)-dependent oxidoreductase [Rhodoferax sp.]|uniref:SDR family NAD(P)-dependent oxidoreductase n=1 Tax=Rhodoferax sp. TaxID=50421 RepID=UPI00345BF85F
MAIVTGGTRGIGLAIAQRLAKEGCRVVVWGRDFGLFERGLAGFSPVLQQMTDVGNLSSVESAFAQTLAVVGPADILINNAGINGPVIPTVKYERSDWDRVIQVNLTGVFNCCRTVVPSMQSQAYGRIVNVSSITGKEGVPGIAAYSAAKAGVIGFTKALAKELATSGVLVNCVAPSMTETDLLKQMTHEHIAAAKAKSPMGRILQVSEVAAMVAWVASPQCSFTTGFTFDISGGRAAY